MDPEDAAVLREEVYRLVGPEGEVLPPVIDFDVLFIPDSHKRIEMLAPQLAYHEVKGVRLLGSSEWNHPDLVRIGRHHVSGSVISTPFFAESPYASVQTFVADWRDHFGGEPGVFGALGFDAANLVLLQLAGSDGERNDVREGLLRVQGYPGVSGVTSMQADGNARRRPYMLGVRRGKIVGLD
jgi:ABC-type branched-subunit amino acid transport system substrate-binding protein